jgi:hypothetical protein
MAEGARLGLKLDAALQWHFCFTELKTLRILCYKAAAHLVLEKQQALALHPQEHLQ